MNGNVKRLRELTIDELRAMTADGIELGKAMQNLHDIGLKFQNKNQWLRAERLYRMGNELLDIATIMADEIREEMTKRGF